MVDANPSISRIKLKVNGLNSPIKSQSLSDWILKTMTQPYTVYKRHTLHSKIKVDF